MVSPTATPLPHAVWTLQQLHPNLLNSRSEAHLQQALAELSISMAWYDQSGWLTTSFGPSITAIIITAFLVVTLPLLLHLYIYRSRSSTSLPSFLLVGPSGSGKTALLTLVRMCIPPQFQLAQLL